MHQHVAQGYIAAVFGMVADGVFFADVFSFDDDGGHEFSKKSKVKGEKIKVKSEENNSGEYT